MNTPPFLCILLAVLLLGACKAPRTPPDPPTEDPAGPEVEPIDASPAPPVEVTQHEQPLQRGEKVGYEEAWAAFVAALAKSGPRAPQLLPWHLVATRHRRAAAEGDIFVDVKVVDGQGHFVTGLAVARQCLAWRVMSDSPSCEIEVSSVTESDQKARLLGVAADYSGSLNDQRRELTNAILAVRDYVESRTGEFVLVAFGKDEVPFGLYLSPTQVDPKAIEYLHTAEGGATPYIDAIGLTLEAIGEIGTTPAAVVVWSDGGENSSILREPYVIDLARRFQLPIYSVGIGTQDQAALQRLAIDTGGNYYADVEYTEIGQVLSDAAFGQEAFYTVSINSSGDCRTLRTVVVSLDSIGCGSNVVVETARSVPILQVQGTPPPEFVSLYFDSGDHTNPKLADGSEASYGDVDGLLRSIAWYLRNFPSASVKIDGYADSKGRNTLNTRLSRARRETVQERLWSSVQAFETHAPWLPKVEKPRINSGRGHGEQKSPVDDTDSPNERRVDIRILHEQAK